MGYQLRMVRPDWVHPKDQNNKYIPLYDSSEKNERMNKSENIYYENDFMPDWKKEEATHYMMYETISEGTPISPIFSTQEELAEFLSDGDDDAYWAWLGIM